MIDTDDPAKLAKQEAIAKLYRDQDREDMRAMLSTRGGRAVLWAILSKCGVYRQSFMGEFPMETAFECGKREIGLWLLTENILTVNEQAYILMRQEAQARQQEKERMSDNG